MIAKPTDAELAILGILWKHGPSTVREVHERLGDKEVGYTTTLKQLQNMFDKGLVSRDDSNRSHVYEASFSKAEIEEKLVKTFMDGVFGGSAMRLVTRALAVEGTSNEERKEIRRLLQEMEASHDVAD